MPTIASSQVPPPKSWDEFEDIVLSSSKLRYSSTEFSRNGRTGQKQDGVDVYGKDADDRQIGVQCKNTISGVKFSTVCEEVENAEGFVPTIETLILGTTAPRDAELQKKVRILSEDRKQQGKFEVMILFWDDIVQDLAKDDSEFFKHYPEFRKRSTDTVNPDEELFDEFIRLLPSNGVIRFVDQTNMAGFPFKIRNLDPLREFAHEWNVPEKEFLYQPLEKLRRILLDASVQYLGEIATNTWPMDNDIERHSVPPEWEIDQPDRFIEVVKKLHGLAGEIVNTHADLVRQARKHFNT